jgi:RNA-directed DNA polymerase
MKALRSLQDRRRRLDPKAQSDPPPRCWGLLGPVAKRDPLPEADPQAQRKGGAPGLAGRTLADMEAKGLEQFLRALRDERVAGPSQPHPNRVGERPQGEGKVRKRQLPCLRARVVQGVLKLSLAAIFAADLCPNSYG